MRYFCSGTRQGKGPCLIPFLVSTYQWYDQDEMVNDDAFVGSIKRCVKAYHTFPDRDRKSSLVIVTSGIKLMCYGHANSQTGLNSLRGRISILKHFFVGTPYL